MQLQPDSYLDTVAMVSITFVGFSTIFATFRQALGGTMSKYDLLLTRNILHLGFLVVLGSLLPPLLALLAAPSGVITRGASLLIAIPTVAFNVTYPARRRAATGTPMPRKVWVDLILIYIAAAVLLANVLGVPVASGIGPHALGLTILLFATFLAFLFGLDLLPREPARPVTRKS
jgi:hypothetical protein